MTDPCSTVSMLTGDRSQTNLSVSNLLAVNRLRANNAAIVDLCVSRINVDFPSLYTLFTGSFVAAAPGEETAFFLFPMGPSTEAGTSAGFAYTHYSPRAVRLENFRALCNLNTLQSDNTYVLTVYTGATLATLAASTLTVTLSALATSGVSTGFVDIAADSLVAIHLSGTTSLPAGFNVTWTLDSSSL